MDIGTNRESIDAAFKEQERGRLTHIINQWNSKRLDLFEISQPDQDLKYYGVMRFYWEDQVAGNVATKCLRVSCTDTTQEVTGTLLEKFRPDMKLKVDSFSLYEVHINKGERLLELKEKPLLVQLSWIQNNCEGRFVLRNTKTSPQNTEEVKKEKTGVIQNFKRTLSKKDKKDKKRDNSVGDNKNGKENGPPEARAHAGQTKQASLPKTKRMDEEAFLVAIVSYTSSTVHFPLSPAYAFYLVARSLLGGTHDSVHHIATITNKMVAMIDTVIEKHRTIAVSLAFWMANASELLNFLRQDRDLNPLTRPTQKTLAQLVHHSFRYLSQRLQKDLERHMPSFLTDAKDQTTKPSAIEGVLNGLVRAMSLLRRCRVNAAFSIQLFSQLLHFISGWLVNWLLGSGPALRGHHRRSPLWLETMRQRLALVSAWAERQGLELAADCHLSLVMQAITLLSMNAHTMQDTKRVHEACFKLNSLQIRTLSANMPTIPPGMIDNLVSMAEITTDNMLKREGWEIRLEVDVDLRLPFLLPEDGYTCDSMQGIPHGFRDFLEPICHKGFCSLMFHPLSSGTWTVFFSRTDSVSSGSSNLCHETNSTELMKPDVTMIALKKPLHRGLGLSIVAAKGAGHNKLGIFIKSIVRGGAAHVDGRLTTGDQLLSVNGQSLVGLSQEKAADILLHSSSVVNLEVVKSAAVFYGLDDMLIEPPAVTTRAETTEHISPCKKLMGMRGDPKAAVLMRNRWEYRSNPNLAYPHSDSCEMSVDPVTPANKITSISTGNLLEEPGFPPCPPEPVWGHQRDYLTLPTPRSHSTREPEQTLCTAPPDRPTGVNTMRHARSQENLCEERRSPSVLDKSQIWKSQYDLAKQQTASQSIAIPVQSHFSTMTRASHQGQWRASQTGTLMKTSQPTRIDVPASPSHGLSFVTFRPPAASPAADQSHSGSHALLRTPPHAVLLQDRPTPGQHRPAPVPACSTLPRPRLASISAQQQRLSVRPQTSILRPASTPPAPKGSPSQALTSPHGLGSAPASRHTRPPAGLTAESPAGSGLWLDPWRREERERLQKQFRHQAVDQLEQEVLQLQGKVQRTLEESERLRRLSLEWQFQKRLQEFQQSESDEDGDVDIGEHERRQEERRTVVEPMEHSINQLQGKGHEEEAEVKSQLKGEVKGENAEGDFDQVKAPEKLSFKERQKLFALAVSS
ncbi:afadin [Sardina pilchardus]|uniref:afadin n=1 Tax=Sardina pilchardus TaxID=27697 RepID=UPI002E12F059